MGGGRLLGLFCAVALAAPAAAYAAPGQVDTSFGSSGTAALGTPFMHAAGVATLPDSRFVVGGGTGSGGPPSRWLLARVKPDGSPDPSFGTNGRLDPGQDGAIVAVAALADGGTIAMGQTYSGYNALMKLKPDGSRDPGFGSNGFVQSPVSGSDVRPFALGIDPSGRLLIVGIAGGEDGPEVMVERFTADGKVDTSFDGDGRFLRQLGQSAPGSHGATYGTDIGFDSRGRIVISGFWFDQSPPDNGVYLWAGRLGDNGTPDPSFGNGGFSGVRIEGGIPSGIYTLGVLDGDRIAVVGEQGGADTTGGIVIASFDSAGKPAGAQTVPLLDAAVFATAPAPGGRTLVSGRADDAQNNDVGFAMRLTAAGDVDTGWGSAGITTFPYPFASYEGTGVAPTPDGGAVVAGDLGRSDGVEGSLVRLTGDGASGGSGGGGAGGGSGSTDPLPPGDNQTEFVIGKPVFRKGRLSLRLRCGKVGRCRGAVKLTRGKRRLARTTFSIASGKAGRVSLRPRARVGRVRLTLLLIKPSRTVVTATVRLR